MSQLPHNRTIRTSIPALPTPATSPLSACPRSSQSSAHCCVHPVVLLWCVSARALLLPAKPASALDETLPLVQALVGIALELHASPASDASHIVEGSVEFELEKKKESQRLTSLYKLFPAMLDVVAVDGFRPDRITDISVLVELAIQRFTQDMDHAVHLLTHTTSTAAASFSSSPSSSDPLSQPQQSVSSQPCNPQGFHTEAWQFLTMLSRLLLFDSMDVIGPAALSHLPTALILFIGKLQGKLAERRQGIASSTSSLPFSPPLVTALDIPSIKLHPYTTAPTTFEQLHSQVFGMLYIMCKHEDPLFDVMFGGHLRTLFSVFTNGEVCEKSFHDEAPDDNAAVVWAMEGAKLTSSLHFVSSASFRAGVMMVMNGIMQHHPQDGLEYIQAHDILTQLLGTISAPYPPPLASASQEPDPALEMVVDCVRLMMLILRTAIRHAPTTTYHPPPLSQKASNALQQVSHLHSSTSSSMSNLPLASSAAASLSATSPLPLPSAAPLSVSSSGGHLSTASSSASFTSIVRPLHTSASSNSVASSLSVPPDLFAPLPQATCQLLEEFELSGGYDTLRQFVASVLSEYEVKVNAAQAEEEKKREEEERLERQRRRSRGGSVSGDSSRRRKSYVQKGRNKQSMVDDLLQQMRELVFIGVRVLKPTADQYVNTQQPLSFSRATVRQTFSPVHNLRKSRSQLGLNRRTQQPSAVSRTTGLDEDGRGRRSDRLEYRNYYHVDAIYDTLEEFDSVHNAHIPALSIPASQPTTSHSHHVHLHVTRPFSIHSSSTSMQHIQSLPAFSALFDLCRHSTSSYVRLMCLLHVQSIVAAHPYNYLVLKDQHHVNLFNFLLHLLDDEQADDRLKDVAAHMLGFIVSFEYYVPYAELKALVDSFVPTKAAATEKHKQRMEEVKAKQREDSDEQFSADDGDLATESFSSSAVLPLSAVSPSASVFVGRVLCRLMSADRVYSQNVLRDLGLLRLSIDRMFAYESHLDIVERGASKKMTHDQQDEQLKNAHTSRMPLQDQHLLHSAMDVLHALTLHHYEHQQILKTLDAGKAYTLLTRLLMSEVTRRRAIRQMEALVELELNGVRMFPVDTHTNSHSSHTAVASGAGAAGGTGAVDGMRNERGREALRDGLDALRRDSASVQSSGQRSSISLAAFIPTDSSVSSTPAAASRDASAASSRAHSRAASVTTSTSSLSSTSSTDAAKESSRHGVQAYITLLLDLLHELPVWNYEAKCLFLRSLRWLCSVSRRAQDFFRQRSGFFNLLLLLDKVKVPELQRRKALRRRQDNSKTAAEMNKLRGSAAASELDDMRAKEEQRLDQLLLFVRAVFLTLVAAMANNAHSRMHLTRFGYDRIMDALHQTEVFGHKHSLECIAVWFVWLAVEYRQGTDDGSEESFDATATLHPSNALNPADLMLPTPAQTLVPLFACASVSLLYKAAVDFQQRVITYLYVLARDDVGSRSALGKVGFLSLLLDLYKPVLLAAPDALTDVKKELRATLLLFVRVLTSFTSSAADVNTLFSFLEEERWSHLIDPLIDMTDHGNQNGRLWPYVYFDLSKRHVGSVSESKRGASIVIDTVRTSSGQWPPRDGYTYSAWLCVDQFSLDDEQRMLLPSPISAQLDTYVGSANPAALSNPSASSPLSASSVITLLCCESDDGRSYLHLYLRNRQLYVQTSRAVTLHFHQFTFEPRAWYHLLVSHSAGGLVAASRVCLFVNGQLQQAIRSNYVEPPLTPTAGVHAYIGALPDRKGRKRMTSPASSLMREIIREAREEDELTDEAADGSSSEDEEEQQEAESSAVSLGVPLTALRLRAPRKLVPFSLSTMSSMINFTNLGGVQWRLAQVQLLEVAVPDERVAALYFSNPKDASSSLELGAKKAGKDSGRFVVQAHDCYHSENRLRAYLTSQSNVSKGSSVGDSVIASAPPRPRAQPSPLIPADKVLVLYHASSYFLAQDHQHIALLNWGQDQFHPQVSHGALRGECHLYRPRGLPDSIHKVGGLKRVLVLLARCDSSEAMQKALLFLVLLLTDSPKNHEEMDELGYRLLAFVLKHRVHLLTSRIVDCLFALCGLSDDCTTGHIANTAAFEALTMDFGLWRDASFSVKRRVFQGWINAVTSNAQKDANVQAMRAARMVNFLTSLLADQHEAQFRLCLAPLALTLLSAMLREDLREHELRLVADLIYSPSLSDEHNPQPAAVDNSALPVDKKNRSASMEGEELLPDLSDTYLRNSLLEMLLNVLLRLQQHYASVHAVLTGNRSMQAEKERERRDKVRVFSGVMDLDWMYGVLQQASASPVSFAAAEELEDIDAITDPKLHTQTAVLVLKLLCVLLTSDPALRERYTVIHWHLSLTHCLRNANHCLSEQVYEVLLGIMIGKQILGGASTTESEEVRREEKEADRRQKEGEAGRAATVNGHNNGNADGDGGLSINTGEDASLYAPPPVLSPSKLTGESSPWDYLMFHTDDEGREVCDAYLFMPELLPTIFALLIRALEIASSKPDPSAHPAYVAALPSIVDGLLSNVFVFFFKFFQKSADFRLLFTMTNSAFLVELVSVVISKAAADEKRRSMERLLSAASSPASVQLSSLANHDIKLLQRPDSSRSSVASSTRRTGLGSDSDDEDTFLSGFRASSAAMPPSALFKRRFGGDSDSDDDSALSTFSVNESMYSDAIKEMKRTESSNSNRSFSDLDEEAALQEQDSNPHSLAERADFDLNTPHGPLVNPVAPPPPPSDDVSAADFPLTTVDFSDKCTALLYRCLCQVIFHALQNDRVRSQQHNAQLPANLSMLNGLFLSPGNTIDHVTGLALPSPNAPPSVVGSTEGWTVVEDMLDLVGPPPNVSSAVRIDFQTRLLRYLASRVQSRCSVWSGEVMSNGKLLNNFLKLCQLWINRLQQGFFQQGVFVVCEVCVAMLESATFQGATLKQGLFSSSTNKTKAKVVTALLHSLNRALLLGYEDASRRQSLTELQWCNALVLAHPKHFIDQPAEFSDVSALACLLYQQFDQILFAEMWLQSRSAKQNKLRVAGYECANEDELNLLAVRCRAGAMSIMAALLRCGKVDSIWRLLLQGGSGESEKGGGGSLFLNKHTRSIKQLFSLGFECMLNDRGGELLDWVMEYERDIKLCLSNTIVPRWQEFTRQVAVERKSQFTLIEARIRAYQRLQSMEANERSRVLTVNEQRTARQMKAVYDGWVAAVLKRHDAEDQERVQQEQWEQMLRELKKLEVQLAEKEEKAFEARKQASQAAARSEGAAGPDSKGADKLKAAGLLAEEELASDLDRKKRKEQQARWRVDAASFWERNALTKRHSRRRANVDGEEAESSGDAANGSGGGGFGRRRGGGRAQLAGSLAPSSGLDIAAFKVDPNVLSSLLNNPMLAGMMQSIMSNPALLQQMVSNNPQLSKQDPASIQRAMRDPAILQNVVAGMLSGAFTTGSGGGAGGGGGGGGVAGGPASSIGAGAAVAVRADLLSAIQKRKSSSSPPDIVVGEAAPPPPPPFDGPSFAPPSLSSPFASSGGDDDDSGDYKPSKLPMFSSALDAPAAPPLDVPPAPPLDMGDVSAAPPMAPPLDGTPDAPPMAPPMGAPDAPPLAPTFGVPDAPTAPSFKKPAPNVKMKKLHWEAVDSGAALSADSIWSQLQPANAEIDFGEFESRFSASAAKPVATRPAEAAKPKFFSLLDPRRQQAIEIGLSRFGMGHADIVAAILAVDTTKLSTEHFKRLVQFMPTADEMKALRAFRGEQAQLGVAERFHMSLLHIPALAQRLEACVNMLTLDERCAWLDNQLTVVEAAMRAIKDSKHLQEVLTTVLAFGNYMNGSSAKMVAGFKLSTLTRLGSTKSADNKTSLLHYLVLHLEKSKPETRLFLDDLQPTKEAHRIETAFLTTEMGALRSMISQMKEAVRAVQSSPPPADMADTDRFLSVVPPAVESGSVRVSSVDERLKAALHKGEKLAKYFGETDMKWEELFSLFLQFRTQYEAAEADVQKERELHKQREKNKALQATLKQKRANHADNHQPAAAH